MPKKYRLTAHFDYSCESPNEYGSFVIRSFSTRHVDNVNPEVYTQKDCPTCDGYGLNRDDATDSTDCPKCEGYGTIECNLMDHPDVLATLSYYEHGACRWMVGPSSVPDYGGFDTVNVAGVLVWNPQNEDEERSWFSEKPADEQAKILDSVVDYYTEWANGNCFGYSLDKLEQCGECGNVEAGENVDSCWGFIGEDEFNSLLNHEALHGIDPADVEVVGEAADFVELKQTESV